MRRSSSAPIGGRLRPGVALCAVVAGAFWLSPPSIGTSIAGEAEQTKGKPPTVQVAQYYGPEIFRDTPITRGKTVQERYRPDYVPLGVRAGSFIIYPSFNLHEAYSDNIFSTQTGEVDDFITRFIPQVAIESDWNNHSLAIFGEADIGRHRDNSFEDFDDYSFGARGRLDVLRSTWLKAKAETRHLHESRASPDNVGGRHPTEYDLHIAGVEGYHKLNRFNFTLGSELKRFDFEDALDGLAMPIDNDDRDRDEVETSFRVGYEIVPEYEAFVRMAYFVRNYDASVDGMGFNRDSDGYEAVAGVKIDFGGVTFGDFFLGYRKQFYDDPAFSNSEGPTIGAKITWNVTQLTTVIGTISRQIMETTVEDGGSVASGSFLTTFGVSAQHELLRNLLLGADVIYSSDEFKGIDRTDDVFQVGLNASYMMYRNLFVRGGYEYTERNSDIPGLDFNKNMVFLRLQAQY